MLVKCKILHLKFLFFHRLYFRVGYRKYAKIQDLVIFKKIFLEYNKFKYLTHKQNRIKLISKIDI